MNNKSATCSDTGPATVDEPFCTLQAALDIVNPGETIAGSGSYPPFTLSRSGAPGQPITIEPMLLQGIPSAALTIQTNASGASAVLNGVHDVVLLRTTINNGSTAGINLIGASNVTMDRLLLVGFTTAPAVVVDGSSSNVMIERSRTGLTTAPHAVQIEPGAAHVTISTNDFNALKADTISVDGATDVNVTSNTASTSCGAVVSFGGGSSGTIENNVFAPLPTTTCTRGSTDISVSADSAPGTTADYNAPVSWTNVLVRYSWAGTTYTSIGDFTSATGQAAHDVLYQTNSFRSLSEHSPLIDSADSNAPGQLATDETGNPRVDDLLVNDTGAGPVTYYDRGAYDFHDQVFFNSSAPVAAIAGTAVQLPTARDTWGEPITYAVVYGDDTSGGGSGPQTHVYNTPGAYSGTITATTSGLGFAEIALTAISETVTLPTPTASAAPTLIGGALVPGSATVNYNLADTFEIRGAAINWFSNDPSWVPIVGSGSRSFGFGGPGTYPITLTITDFLGRSVTTAPMSYQAGLGTRIDTPFRAYDSRTTKVRVPARGVVQVNGMQFPPYGTSGIEPSSAIMTMTVTNASRSGYITAYPDRTTRPMVSSLNFTAGVTVANTAEVPFGPNGVVDFYNGSAGPIDLILDASADQAQGVMLPIDGVPASANPGSFVAIPPVRVLDTRNGTGTGGKPVVVAGRHFQKVQLASVPGIPAGFTGAVLLNVATTQTTSSGWLGLSSSGTTTPTTSASNWTSGRTVSNLVLAPVSNGVTYLFNGGTGSVAFVADVNGYVVGWGQGNHGYYTPTGPTRLLDTRTGTGTGGHIGKLAAGHSITLHITGETNVTAASLNLTATGAISSGYLTAYPAGTSRPLASNVNYRAGAATANFAVTAVGTGGSITIYNSGPSAVDVIADLNGTYFTYQPN